MSPTATAIAPITLAAVREGRDRVVQALCGLSPEAATVALECVVASYGAARFPDVDPRAFADAFATRVAGLLRDAPSLLVPVSAP